MLDKCPYIHERVKTTKSTVSHSIALQTALFHNKEALAKFLLPLVFSFSWDEDVAITTDRKKNT